MIVMELLLLFGVFVMCIIPTMNAKHGEDKYIEAVEPEVKEKLEQWQDVKFGLFMHWGPYTQWGVMESWTICNEDWIEREQGNFSSYEQYKNDYHNLYKTFNPVQFDPQKWVQAAQKAGMKYMVFTTKHHDGFCMFDTETTNYKITSKDCPFHSNSRANITREIFDAFRKEDFLIGAYFSKPDWYCKNYWWPYYATPDRHVNYDPAKFPERWQKYKDYSYNQIEELMTNYGPIDILWLDGAWVRPLENMPKEYISWARKNNWDQDIDMGRIVEMSRKHQPGLIVVDRWVSGRYENYLTPEQVIPDYAIQVPWESCITITPGWAYNEKHEYKSVRQLIHMLVEIVAKGGNFLLNIGPSPYGDWDEKAYDRLTGIGEWMQVNQTAIYGTNPKFPFKECKVCLTEKKDGTVYAIYLPSEGENHPPSKIWMSSYQPHENAKMTMLGSTVELKWETVGNGFLVHIPEAIQQNPMCEHAWVVKIR